MFAACSSLTLVGYVWVAAGLLWTAYLALRGKRGKTGYGPALRVGGGTLTLLATYLVLNADLLRSFTGKGFRSDTTGPQFHSTASRAHRQTSPIRLQAAPSRPEGQYAEQEYAADVAGRLPSGDMGEHIHGGCVLTD